MTVHTHLRQLLFEYLSRRVYLTEERMLADIEYIETFLTLPPE